jgi:hypothetical protein
MITLTRAKELMSAFKNTGRAHPLLLEYIFSLDKYKHLKGQKLVLKAGRYKGYDYFSPYLGDVKIVLAKNKPSRRAKVLAAFREEVQPQIAEYKSSVQIKRAEAWAKKDIKAYDELSSCSITGARLSSKTHVDHIGKPFIQIADEFITSLGLSAYNEIRLNKSTLSAWSDWHKEHAEYALASAKANIKKGASNYKSKYKV